MAMMLLVSGLLLTVPAIYGRSLSEEDPCQLVITKDGHEIINGSAAVAFTGRLNQVLCSLQCPGIHIPPALTWFKGDREEQGGKKIPEAIRRVATSTTAAKRISWLNILNMKDSDMGRYTCVGYKDGYGMVWASLDLEYVCRGSMFMCDVSKCVPKEKACDGVSDCFDGIDERQCPPECDEGNEFLCDNKCLPRSYRCNGMVDCEGGHDEENCTSTILPTTTTTPTTTPTSTTSTSTTESTACSNEDFKCNNDTCIPKANFCNGEPDCEDGEDELNCTTTVDDSTTAAPTTPATTTTTATPSTTAAPTTPATPTTTATPTTVTTTTSTVITTTSAEATTINDLFWALAIVNTNNEVLVTNGNETTLTIEEDDVSTGLTLSCQSFGDVEDPQLNWQIGSNVLTSTSTSHTLKVNLIPEHLQSGEAVACLARETTSGRMINASVGFIINRTQGCKGDQFKCNDGSCIDSSSVNNGFPDCDNGEDETATRTCLEGQILCSDKSHCIASSDVCDGKDDCNDHGDEVNCPPNKEQTEAISNV